MLCGFSCQYILIQKIRLNYTETNDLLKRYVTKDTEETLYLSQAVQYTGAIVDYKYMKYSNTAAFPPAHSPTALSATAPSLVIEILHVNMVVSVPLLHKTKLSNSRMGTIEQWCSAPLLKFPFNFGG